MVLAPTNAASWTVPDIEFSSLVVFALGCSRRIRSGRMLTVLALPNTFFASSPLKIFAVPRKPATNLVAGLL